MRPLEFHVFVLTFRLTYLMVRESLPDHADRNAIFRRHACSLSHPVAQLECLALPRAGQRVDVHLIESNEMESSTYLAYLHRLC